MRPHNVKTGNAGWDKEIARNTHLFYEADQLDVDAYKILGDENIDPSTLSRFSEAKKRADQKYAEAYQDWIRIKKMITNVAQ
jgi:hypothetical protein